MAHVPGCSPAGPTLRCLRVREARAVGSGELGRPQQPDAFRPLRLELALTGLNGVLERGIYSVDVDRLLYERREPESIIVTTAGRIMCFVWHTWRRIHERSLQPEESGNKSKLPAINARFPARRRGPGRQPGGAEQREAPGRRRAPGHNPSSPACGSDGPIMRTLHSIEGRAERQTARLPAETSLLRSLTQRD